MWAAGRGGLWVSENITVYQNQGINYPVFNDFVGFYSLFIDIGNLVKTRVADMRSLETNRYNYGELRKCHRKGRS